MAAVDVSESRILESRADRPPSVQRSRQIRCRLDSNFVVHGSGNSLNTAKVALRGLRRDMAGKELNLLKFTAGCPT
jgi:hypothetical protein